MLSSEVGKRAPSLAIAHSREVVCVHAQLGVQAPLERAARMRTCLESTDKRRGSMPTSFKLCQSAALQADSATPGCARAFSDRTAARRQRHARAACGLPHSAAAFASGRPSAAPRACHHAAAFKQRARPSHCACR